MRTRLVFWGKTAQEERALLGFMLNEEDNNIDVFIFPEKGITEDFVKQMHEDWRSGKDLLFPENHEKLQIPLTITGSLVPEGYTLEREDILNRAQTEWQFIVLSSRLYRTYNDELEDLKEKFGKLKKFDAALYNDLKRFWTKVQGQVREKNLFRDHANKIRKHTDSLFEDLKKLRKAFDQEFHERSEKHVAQFKSALEAIDKKIEDGLSLQMIFQELKDLQKSFRDTDFTGDHRSHIWKSLDGLFKKVKEKKFGPELASKSDPFVRVKRRYDGLMVAIEKMERSIERDKSELKFHTRLMEQADGSLESQLRAAKTRMISERVTSKESKYQEMKSTQVELERKMASLEKRKAQQELEAKVKREIKEKIQHDIKQAEESRTDDDKVQRAVDAIQNPETRDADTVPTVKKKAEQIIASVEERVEDGLEDVVDTIKAIAFVIEDNFKKVITDWSKEEE